MQAGMMGNCRKVLVTPALAQKWLKNNETNRPLVESQVQKYVDKIRLRQWIPAICFFLIGDHGELLNGQHRLHAIIRTGVSVWAYVVEGVSGGACFYGVDTDILVRQLANLLPKGTKNRAMNASATRVIWVLEHGDPVRGTIMELLQCWKDHAVHIGWAISAFNRRKNVYRAPVLGTFAYMHEVKSVRQQVEALAHEVVSTVGRSNNDVSIALERAIDTYRTARHKNARALREKCLYALQLYCEGDTISRLKATGAGLEWALGLHGKQLPQKTNDSQKKNRQNSFEV
jgi:hypothetical protein